MMIFHIHLAVIHTFSTSVSCQDCMKLQFRRLHPQICWVEYTQNRTALLVIGFNSKPKHFFSRDLMCILRSKVLDMAWAELLPPFIGLLLLGGDGFYLYSYSVRANCTRTCNIQAGLKVCGTNTHSLVFFCRVVFIHLPRVLFYKNVKRNQKIKKKMKRNKQKKHACGLGSGGAIPESCDCLLRGERVRVCERLFRQAWPKVCLWAFWCTISGKPDTQRESAPVYGAFLNQKNKDLEFQVNFNSVNSSVFM